MPTPTERIQVPHTCAVDNDCAACKALDAAREASDQRQVVVLRKENAKLRAELAAAKRLSEAERKVLAIAKILAAKLSSEGSADDDIGDELFELHEEVAALKALRAQVKP